MTVKRTTSRGSTELAEVRLHAGGFGDGGEITRRS